MRNWIERTWTRGASDENREEQLAIHGRLTVLADSCFRIVEMTIVTGLVHYLEIRLSAAPIASNLLVALIATYARGKVSSGILPAVDRYGTTVSKRRFFYWLFWAIGTAVALASILLVNDIVPKLAEIESSR